MTAESTPPPQDDAAAEPVMSVCGSPTEVMESDENEATSSYLFRVLFGACTNGTSQPSAKRSSSSGGGGDGDGDVGGNASLSSLRHQTSSLKKSLRHAMVDAEEGRVGGIAAAGGAANNQDEGIEPVGDAGLTLGPDDGGRRSGAAAAAASKRRSESRARARNVQPPPEIESGPCPMTTKSRSKKFDPTRNASNSKQQPSNSGTAAHTAAMEETSPDSPYRVSEVPRPLPAESMDEADDVSYCFDDGISAISAHTLEEMARLNPAPPSIRSRRATAVDEPEEEGFDISIKENGTGTPTNMTDNSNNRGSKTSTPKDHKSTSANPRHKLPSTPRAANGDGPHDIHNVDESGDGVGALPVHGPDRFDRMRSTNTRTSRTTATSASSDFENRFRRDEAAFWDEEARKAKTIAGNVPASRSAAKSAVDENGFPIVVDQFPSTLSKISSGKSLASKTTATTRKKLHDRTRSSDLTAPTANLTMHTMGSSPNLTDSHDTTEHSFISQPSRHPHDTTPFDIAHCVPQPPTSPMESPTSIMDDDEAGGNLTSRRLESRKLRLHDSLVRRGLMMMKGGAKLPSEVHESPASEIFISAPEVGEI